MRRIMENWELTCQCLASSIYDTSEKIQEKTNAKLCFAHAYVLVHLNFADRVSRASTLPFIMTV